MIVREQFDNGLCLLTESMPDVRSVSFAAWLTRGSRHESATHSGIAHFIEHMLFKGTTRRATAPEISEASIDGSAHIVGMMGHEPISAELERGAEVVLAGRCWPKNSRILAWLARTLFSAPRHHLSCFGICIFYVEARPTTRLDRK